MPGPYRDISHAKIIKTKEVPMSEAATNPRPKNSTLIRRFLPYMAKYRGVLAFDLFCAALTTLCDIALPSIMRTLTNTVSAAALTVDTVLRLAALYFVLRIIDGAASYFMSGIGHIMGVHIETDMRRDAFDHLLRLDHTYYNNTKVGQIMGRITNDLFDVTEFAHHCPEEFFIAGIKIAASFVILCQANVPLTLVVFACVPLMGVVSVKLNRKLRERFRQQRFQIGELNATIEDSLLGQRVVKAFAAEDMEREKFAQGNRDFEQIKTLSYHAMAAFNTSTRLFDGLMYFVVILAGGLSLVYGAISAGDLVAYVLYVSTLIATIRRIVEFAEQFQRGMTGIERFAEIMDTPVTIADAPDAKPLVVKDGTVFVCILICFVISIARSSEIRSIIGCNRWSHDMANGLNLIAKQFLPRLIHTIKFRIHLNPHSVIIYTTKTINGIPFYISDSIRVITLLNLTCIPTFGIIE